MKVEKIAIDVDGVLADQMPAFLQIIEKRYGVVASADDIICYSFATSLGLPKGADRVLLREYNKAYIDHLSVIRNAATVVKKLAQHFHIIVISSRQLNSTHTQRWIAKNHIVYDEFVSWSLRPKVDYCLKNKIKVLVEDSGEKATLAAKRGVMVLLFDRPYNQMFDHKNITRVRNWAQAYKVLMRLKKVSFR